MIMASDTHIQRCQHPASALGFSDFTGGVFCRDCSNVWYQCGSSDRTPLFHVLLAKLHIHEIQNEQKSHPAS